jgi:hypothetical protein
MAAHRKRDQSGPVGDFQTQRFRLDVFVQIGVLRFLARRMGLFSASHSVLIRW